MEKIEYSYPNQRKISINKDSCGNGELYTKIRIQSMNYAMENLSANTYKVWCYLAQNRNKYSMWLSPADVCDITHISKSTYHRAFKELVDKSYLVRSLEKKNKYDFFESSHILQEECNKIKMDT